MRRLLLPLMILAAAPAFAQDSDVNARLDRIERDLSFVQKQVYNGAAGGESDEGAAPMPSGSAAAQFTQIEEEIRQLRGQMEQIQYQSTKNAQDLQKFMGDTDYRLQAIEQKEAAAAAAQAAAAAPPPAPAATPEAAPAAEAAPTTPATYQKDGAAKDAAAKETPASPTGKDFPNANALYNHSFDLLKQKDYTGAAASFDNFVKTYPTDPLTPNAYYWLGESYYTRGDYTRSAESFRKGFENAPDGQKAPDNLLKLAMSLDKVKRTKEACIVLKQVVTKYNDSAPRTAAKATEQMTSMQCSK